MKTRAKKAAKPKKAGGAYLTKRVVNSASRNAILRASKRAMQVAGYLIKAENGWVVRQNQDGSIVKIRRYHKAHHSTKLVLD